MADRKDIEFNFIGLDEGVRKAATISDSLKQAAVFAKLIGETSFDLGKYNASIPGQGVVPGEGPRAGSISTPGSSANNAFMYRLNQQQYKFFVNANTATARVGAFAGGVALRPL